MSETIPNSGDQSEVFTGTRTDPEVSRGIQIVKTAYERRFMDVFHNSDNEIRKRLGYKILASLDYVHPGKSEPYVDYRHSGQVFRLPVKPIVRAFEEVMEGERDTAYPPIPVNLPETNLPLVQGAGYSPKIGVFLNQPLFLKGRFFVLNPDEYIQRGVIQLIVARSEESPALGEVWLSKKWLNLPQDPQISGAESNKIAIPA